MNTGGNIRDFFSLMYCYKKSLQAKTIYYSRNFYQHYIMLFSYGRCVAGVVPSKKQYPRSGSKGQILTKQTEATADVVVHVNWLDDIMKSVRQEELRTTTVISLLRDLGGQDG
jgi:hypothetical protein